MARGRGVRLWVSALEIDISALTTYNTPVGVGWAVAQHCAVR